MIKPANRYKTRLGRRLAVILYAIPSVPLLVVCGAIHGAASFVAEVAPVIKNTWNQ